MQNNKEINFEIDSPAATSGFNLKDFIIRYSKYLPLIILGVLIAYTAAKFKIRYSNESFQAEGTMIIKEDKQGGYGDNKNVEDLFTSKSSNDLNTEIQLMKSRFLMKRVVNKMGLQNHYFTKGKVKTSIIYKFQPVELVGLIGTDSLQPINFEIKVLDSNFFTINNLKDKFQFNVPLNNFNSFFKVEKTKYFQQGAIGQKYILGFDNLDDVASRYSGSLKVSQVGDFTRLLKVSITSQSPQLCADIVNNLMNEYISQNKEDNKQVADFSKKFIDERVNNLETELSGIENINKDFREKNDAINLDAQSQVYLANVNEANKSLNSQLLLIGNAKGLLSTFQNDVNVKGYAPIGTLEDNNLQNLFLEFNNKQLLLKQMREYATEDDLTFKEKTNDLRRLRNTIMEGLSKLLIVANINAGELEKNIKENTLKLDKIPYLQKELLNYSREQKIKEELYLFLKKKGEEAGISSASTVSNSNIVDMALVDERPIAPVPSKIYSVALFLGLLIPAAIAYIIELFNDKVRFRDDIQKQTRTPIIAEVGHNDQGKTLLVQSKSRRVIAEQFRMIRTNIQYLVGTKSKYTVLVTSSFSGEGKSFISTNVAAALALTGKKTVILEFDLRKPKVLDGLGMSKTAGITNFVVGKADIVDIIRKVPETENLWVIGCGAIPPNPAELLLEENINVLFEFLKNNFDAIVIDSAPVGLVTDSMTLSKFSDTTLYIVRHKYTLKKQIKLIDELYTSNKLPKLSIVINDVIGSTGGYYGYGGYGYGYGNKSYGYGTGYFEEEQRSFFKDLWKKFKSFLLFWK